MRSFGDFADNIRIVKYDVAHCTLNNFFLSRTPLSYACQDNYKTVSFDMLLSFRSGFALVDITEHNKVILLTRGTTIAFIYPAF